MSTSSGYGILDKMPEGQESYGGTYNSDGGSLFLANSFNTNGASIYFDSNPNNSPPPKVCDFPSYILSSYFTGRDEELQQIDRVFRTSTSDHPPCCVIWGMPGLGKTQLALKFATLASQDGKYPYVFWISAGSVEKLTQDLSKLADLLRLTRQHSLDQVSKLSRIRAWLEDSNVAKSWLLILDNVNDETAVMLRHILPRRNCGGRILMTCRTATAADMFTASEASSQLALQPPKIDAAMRMLTAGAKLERNGREEVNHTDAKRLVRMVGNLPLAIDQVASYVRATGSSLQQTLDVYRSDETPEMLSWENDLSMNEEKSVVATFTPALNKVRETAPDALTLLRIFSFCDPEGISISIFEQGCDVVHLEHPCESSRALYVDKLETARALRPSLKRIFRPLHRRKQHSTANVEKNDMLEAVEGLFRSPIRLARAIQEIQRLSLAAQTMAENDRILRIHDLVHLLLRSKLMTDTERRHWLRIAICIICKAFKAIGDRTSPQNWGRCGIFINHIKSLQGFAEYYEHENTELLEASKWAALYLHHCGLYGKAATLYKQLLDRWSSILGGQHPAILVIKDNLADVLGRLGKRKEAERLHREILALRKVALGEKHPDTLTSSNNLAEVLIGQGKYTEAERIHRQILALRKSILGEKHVETIESIGNLGRAVQNLGKYSEAERFLQQALALSESVLGEKHIYTLAGMSNLALVLIDLNKLSEAEEKGRRTLVLMKSVLGDKHPLTLGSMNNLAHILGKQGKFEEAEGIQRQTLALQESVLGREHPDTLTSMYNLAHHLQKQGRNEEAVSLMETCFQLRKDVLGPKDPDTLASMHVLAYNSQKQGRNAEAVSLMETCFQLERESLGPEHPHTEASLQALQTWKDNGNEHSDQLS